LVSQGEIWLVDFDPVRGHEQAGRRPALVISNNVFNSTANGMCQVLPLTSTYRGLAAHIEIQAPQGGLRQTSHLMCDQIRTVSDERFVHRIGQLDDAIIDRAIAMVIRMVQRPRR
jgi:mRNA interferase MazF